MAPSRDRYANFAMPRTQTLTLLFQTGNWDARVDPMGSIRASIDEVQLNSHS